MGRLKLTLEYDGTEFSGSQSQPGRRTVQGVLELALERFYGQRVKTWFAGRTDAGVHAVGQVVAFDPVCDYDEDTVMGALNFYLPPDVRVTGVERVPGKFQPRYWAKERHYKYLIWNCSSGGALVRRYFHVVDRPLDVTSMELAAKQLIGTMDFSAFAGKGIGTPKTRIPRGTTVRTVYRAEVRRNHHPLGDHVVEFFISANSYLPHMVRNIVGTLLWVGLGQMSIGQFAEVLSSKDRSRAGPTAPPHGLYLVKVVY